MTWLGLTVVFGVFVAVDLATRLLTRRWVAFACALVLPHAVVIGDLAASSSGRSSVGPIASTSILAAYFLFRFSFHLTRSPVRVSLRLRIMMGGRRIFLTSLGAIALQIPVCVASWKLLADERASSGVMIADIIVTFSMLLLLVTIGIWRILLTSRRLGIGKRLLFLVLGWIPVANAAMGLWFCRIARQEFARELIRTERQNQRVESRICETRYPILMLHGVGFRDYRYLNYWGRIPNLLMRNGATVHYGHQQAWGTIEANAAEIRETVQRIVGETGSEKVNIIAHSKGGLDARYLISGLAMGDRVASLTTISTPHRGSELVIVLRRLSDEKYRRICGFIDARFRRLGDANPDAYTASRQLLPEYLEGFNERYPDDPGVYYQSYAARMKKPTSDGLLAIPNAIMKLVSSDNDGLVTIESAAWGDFKGTFESSTHRGISHGDLIDLMRQDYEGFDIAEEYVKIVSGLKQRGL
ncbi:MAG TPA: triacylglycerol lipase [Polyangia bacterium]|nr:triacylglycerol lipase [Polyangia bacterium]